MFYRRRVAGFRQVFSAWFLIHSKTNIKSDSAMSTATEPARPRCFPPGDVMHESA